MAKKIIQKKGPQSSKFDKIILKAYLTELAHSKKRAAEFRRKAIARHKFRSPLMAALRKAKIHLKRPPAPKYNSFKNRLTRNAEAMLRQQRKIKGSTAKSGTPNLIMGHASGVVSPPYDFQGQQYYIDPPSAATQFPLDAEIAYYPPAIADGQIGYMNAWAIAGQDLASMFSYASMGFIYIPDQAGILFVNSNPLVTFYVEGFAWDWDDYGNADTFISLQIAEFAINGSSWRVIWNYKLPIASVHIGWGWEEQTNSTDGSNDGVGPGAPYPLIGFVAARPGYGYFCNAVIQADTYRGNGGTAQALVRVNLKSFNYYFFTG